MATRSPTEAHSYWGSWPDATALPPSSDPRLQPGDTAYAQAEASLYVYNLSGWTPVSQGITQITADVLAGPGPGSVTATVVALQGRPVPDVAPADGQVLTWNGTDWVPGSPASGGSGGGGQVWFMNGNVAGDPIVPPELPSPAPLPTPQPNPVKQLSLTADTTQTVVTTPFDLPNDGSTFVYVAGFVSDDLTPGLTTIPAGIWDFNVWASASGPSSAANVVRFQVAVYKWDPVGSTTSLLCTSGTGYLYDPSQPIQYAVSAVFPQTTMLLTDRIYVVLQATATSNNHQITFYTGDGTPSHAHTTIPSVSGTGIVHVVNGVIQSPASPVALGAGPTEVSGTLPIANGGTGLSATPGDGELLIGNGTTNAYVKSTLTAGAGISVMNTPGAITVANTGVTSVGVTAPITNTGTGTAPVIALTNPLPVANGGTGTTTPPGNGQLLIGNGTNYTLAGLTAGTGVSITSPSAGNITIATTGGGGAVFAGALTVYVDPVNGTDAPGGGTLGAPYRTINYAYSQVTSLGESAANTSGTATGSQTSTTLQDTTKAWVVNQWAGYTVSLLGGTGSGQSATVVSNTANTLTISTTWATTPVSASTTYILYSQAKVNQFVTEKLIFQLAPGRYSENVLFGFKRARIQLVGDGVQVLGSVTMRAVRNDFPAANMEALRSVLPAPWTGAGALTTFEITGSSGGGVEADATADPFLVTGLSMLLFDEPNVPGNILGSGLSWETNYGQFNFYANKAYLLGGMVYATSYVATPTRGLVTSVLEADSCTIGESGLPYRTYFGAAPYAYAANPTLWNTGTGVVSGTQTTTTLQDTTKAWTVNQWAGYTVTLTSGTGATQTRTVISNTSTTLTISSGATNWATLPVANNTTYSLIGTSGTATGTQTSTTLQDTTKTWVVNQWAGAAVTLTGGTGGGQIATILSNTADTLTISTTWTTTPVAASTTYAVRYSVPEGTLTAKVHNTTLGASLGPRITIGELDGCRIYDLDQTMLGTVGNGGVTGSISSSYIGQVINQFRVYTLTGSGGVPLGVAPSQYQLGSPSGATRYKIDSTSYTTLAFSRSSSTGALTARTLNSPSVPGTATAGGATTLTNASAAWPSSAWVGGTITLTGGTGSGQTRTISSNNATQITVSPAWTTNPAAGTTYTIAPLVAFDFQDDARSLAYTPTNGTQWLDPDPTTVGSALDKVAATGLLAATPASGQIPIGNGTNFTLSTATNGQLLIGNGTGYTPATLTPGAGIAVTNGAGSITVANAGVTSVGVTAPITNTGTATAPTIGLTNPLPVANGGTGLTTVPASGQIPIGNGTGYTLSTAPTNGQLLIGNGTGYTVANLTAGSGISVTDGAGTITIAATGGGGSVTSVTASTPLASSGGATPNISLNVANDRTVYVSPGGSDITGNGTILAPYASIAFALTAIGASTPLPGPTTPYTVAAGPGIYAEANLTVNADITIEGSSNTTINATSITLGDRTSVFNTTLNAPTINVGASNVVNVQNVTFNSPLPALTTTINNSGSLTVINSRGAQNVTYSGGTVIEQSNSYQQTLNVNNVTSYSATANAYLNVNVDNSTVSVVGSSFSGTATASNGATFNIGGSTLGSMLTSTASAVSLNGSSVAGAVLVTGGSLSAGSTTLQGSVTGLSSATVSLAGSSVAGNVAVTGGSFTAGGSTLEGSVTASGGAAVALSLDSYPQNGSSLSGGATEVSTTVVPSSIVLDATATGGAATVIGTLYFPQPRTLTSASVAFIGGSNAATDTATLTLNPAGGGAAVATWTRSDTLGNQSLSSGGVILSAGWYDLTLQETASGSGVAFARGLYLA